MTDAPNARGNRLKATGKKKKEGKKKQMENEK